MPHDRRGGGARAHAREPRRRAPAVLRAVEARGASGRRGAPADCRPAGAHRGDGGPRCGAPALAPGADLDFAQAVQPVEPISPSTSKAETRAEQAVPQAQRPIAQPLTADLNRFHVTVSRQFLQKLETARAALSHSHPGASESEILEAGLDLLLERSAKRKGLAKKPRAVPPPSSDPDHIPAHVRRAVWKRDGGECQFRLASGEICGSTIRVEIDHVTPRALGGPPTEENCRLACRPHNDRAAREVFGDACMDRYTRNPRRGARHELERRPAPTPPG